MTDFLFFFNVIHHIVPIHWDMQSSDVVHVDTKSYSTMYNNIASHIVHTVTQRLDSLKMNLSH